MIILKGAYVIPVSKPDFVGDVAIENGKIIALGANLAFAGAEVIELEGKYVMPGLIDAHSHIGLLQSGTRERDHNDPVNPITPELRAIDAINPFDMAFSEARSGGVTTCVTGPGSINLIGGTFAAIKTCGKVVDDMILKNPAAMKMALGENPKFRYTEQNKTPKSRMASAAIIRAALYRARDYGKDGKLDLGMEALQPVVNGKLPAKIHVHRTDDIATAIRIMNEFGVKYTLDHVTEGYMILEHLQKAVSENCLGLIVGPFLSYKGKLETANRITFTYPRILHEAGIPFAICTDFFENPVERLITCAALSAAEGLPDDIALSAITLSAANITGIADRVGSLDVGKDADIAVFSEHPLSIRAKCVLTLIDGVTVYRKE